MVDFLTPKMDDDIFGEAFDVFEKVSGGCDSTNAIPRKPIDSSGSDSDSDDSDAAEL